MNINKYLLLENAETNKIQSKTFLGVTYKIIFQTRNYFDTHIMKQKYIHNVAVIENCVEL